MSDFYVPEIQIKLSLGVAVRKAQKNGAVSIQHIDAG
jgi:hypothetical protein